MVKLGEGGRERPPRGRANSSPEPAGAGRSCHAASGDYSDASAGCAVVVLRVRVLRSTVELLRVRACLTTRGVPLGLFIYTPEVPVRIGAGRVSPDTL